MNININVGDFWEESVTVTNDNTAKSLGSGTLDVFATPALVGLMEKASYKLVEKNLEKNYTSVGSKIDIKHISPTPIGNEVTAKSKVFEIRGNSITFEVEAWDAKGLIAKGIHRRGIVNIKDFLDISINK